MAFSLHPRLAGGSLPVGDLSITRVLLKDDCRWPWLILVPQRADLRELHDLDASDYAAAAGDIRRASAAMAGLEGVAKVNVGALGNEVPQLHVHVVGRWPGDAAWPGPVWGVAGKIAYPPDEADLRLAALRAALGVAAPQG